MARAVALMGLAVAVTACNPSIQSSDACLDGGLTVDAIAFDHAGSPDTTWCDAAQPDGMAFHDSARSDNQALDTPPFDVTRRDAAMVHDATAHDATAGDGPRCGEAGPRDHASLDAAPALVDLQPCELASLLAHKDFLFINVHIPYYAEIEPTDAFLPYNDVAAIARAIDGDGGHRDDAKVVLYCRSDSMSKSAGDALVALGYRNVAHLKGGMVAWERAGLPLARRDH